MNELNTMKSKIVEMAKKEMLNLKHPYVSSDHLLLALLKCDTTAEFLETYGITYNIFLEEVKSLVGVGENKVDTTPFTPIFKEITKGINHFSKKFKSNDVPMLLLLSMLEYDEGIAMRVLNNMGIDSDDLYDDIINYLNTSVAVLLNKFNCLIDLNHEVKNNKTVVTGFDKELIQLCKYLLKIQKPNVIILGEPGVGKTALVEKLAIAINNKQVPKFLQNLQIVQLSLASAVAGTKYRGEFEDKVCQVIEAVQKNPNIVLFIDEIHTMVGAGGAEGAIDASNIFKPALARGKLKLIGATTNDEYQEAIKSEKAFARRFNTITILESTREETLDILRKAKTKLEKHYELKVSEKDLVKVYEDSTHRDGRMPDVALDALEEFCVERYYERESNKEEVKV